MKHVGHTMIALILSVGTLTWGCSGDDPTGTSRAGIETDFQIGADRVETFTPIDVEVSVMQDGSPMMMQGGQMHVERLGDGSTRTFEMGALEGGFGGMMMFFEPGEYELHLQGMGQMGGAMQELGHHPLTVHRQHRVVGSYWVELAVDPAPVLANGTARIGFLVFQLAEAGPGDPVSGLTARVTIHDPAGQGSTQNLTEADPGDYGTDHTFGEAGLYELHLEIDADGTVATGDFHLPVLATLDDTGLDYRDHHGTHGHGMGL